MPAFKRSRGVVRRLNTSVCGIVFGGAEPRRLVMLVKQKLSRSSGDVVGNLALVVKRQRDDWRRNCSMTTEVKVERVDQCNIVRLTRTSSGPRRYEVKPKKHLRRELLVQNVATIRLRVQRVVKRIRRSLEYSGTIPVDCRNGLYRKGLRRQVKSK
jgi:hypothetical protein